MGAAKEAPKGTPLSVIAKTPSGAILTGVRVTTIGLREEITKPDLDPRNGRPTDKHGRMDWVITDDEFERTADLERQQNPPAVGPDGKPLAADECLLNITATIPGSKFGPEPPKGGKFQAGGTVLVTGGIRFVKGKDGFGPKTPIVLTLMDECLFNFIENLHADIPARNLTLEQAREVLVTFHKQTLIRLIPEPVFDVTNGTCAPQPKSPGVDKCTADTACLKIAGKIDGVQFKTNLNGTTRTSSTASTDPVIDHVDLRNAVGLIRLVRKLKAAFNIIEFHHAGIGRGGDNTLDCHNQGRAVDFVGARVPDPPGGGPDHIYVLEDWAQRSVPDASEIGKPKTKKRLPGIIGADHIKSGWPESDVNTKQQNRTRKDKDGVETTFQVTVFDSFSTNRSQTLEFRLDSLNRAAIEADALGELQVAIAKAGKDPVKVAQAKVDHSAKLDLREASITRARNFFSSMYRFIADDYQDLNQNTSQGPFAAGPPVVNPISAIGSGGSIMNPDHATSMPFGSGGREAHQSHLHFQIGVTVDPKPVKA